MFMEEKHQKDILDKHIQFTNPEKVIFIPTLKDYESDNVHLHVAIHPISKELLAFWTQSTYEGAGDNHAVMARSKDGGSTWSKPKYIVGSIPDEKKKSKQAHWAFPVISKSGRIYVFYFREGYFWDYSRMITGYFACVYSDDIGETWSESCDVDLKVTRFDRHGQLQNNCMYQIPRRLSDGKYYFAYQKYSMTGIDTPREERIDTRIFFARFDNIDDDPEPKDIKITHLPDSEDGIHLDCGITTSFCEEPCTVQLDDGRLFCVMRTKRKCIYYTVSKDMGHTWSEPEPLLFDDGTKFVHPISPCPIYKLNDGRFIQMYHGEEITDNPYFPRNPLRIVYGEYTPEKHQPITFKAGTEKIFMQLPEPEAKELGQFGIHMYGCYVNQDGKDMFWYPDRKFFLLGREF